jgi:hypothetical protein
VRPKRPEVASCLPRRRGSWLAELPRRTLRAEHRDLLDVLRVLVTHGEHATPADRARRGFGGALGAYEHVRGLVALSHVAWLRSCPGCKEHWSSSTAASTTPELVLRTRRGTPLSRHNAARTIRDAAERAPLGHVTSQVLRRTTGTALSEARVPVAASAAIMGHSLEVFHGSYVKAHRDGIERDLARDALVELGLGVTQT